jgi:hypothetical protein
MHRTAKGVEARDIICVQTERKSRCREEEAFYYHDSSPSWKGEHPSTARWAASMGCSHLPEGRGRCPHERARRLDLSSRLQLGLLRHNTTTSTPASPLTAAVPQGTDRRGGADLRDAGRRKVIERPGQAALMCVSPVCPVCRVSALLALEAVVPVATSCATARATRHHDRPPTRRLEPLASNAAYACTRRLARRHAVAARAQRPAACWARRERRERRAQRPAGKVLGGGVGHGGDRRSRLCSARGVTWSRHA